MSQPTPPPSPQGQNPNQQPYQPQGQPYPPTGASTPQPPKKSHKGCWIAAIIVGLILLLILGSCGALLGGAKKVADSAVASQSSAANRVHTITYKATVNGTTKAHVNYGASGQMSTEDITKDWSKDGTATGTYQIVTLMVSNADFQSEDAATTCEIIVDGKSVAKQEGKGASAMASCSYTIEQ